MEPLAPTGDGSAPDARRMIGRLARVDRQPGSEAEQRWVEAAGLRLLVRAWGEPRGRPVLFWHGLSYAGRASLTLNEAGPLLASRHGLYVVAVDVPGFGGSPPTAADGYHPHALAAMVPPLLDAVERERVAFIGHSWGGHIGCHVAARHRERLTALVLLDGGYRDPWHDRSLPFAARLAASESAWEARRASSWEMIVADLRASHRRWNSLIEASWRAGWREVDDGFVPAVSPAVVAAIEHGIAQAPPSTTWADLARSTLPILLVAAGDAPNDDLARFAEAVPQVVVHRAAGTGHDVLADGGPAVIGVVGDWLQQH
jgi:pimeloyl-ACP methyl ester carboxylesterase